MSAISPQLRASARGAYRSIFRAARITFAGDDEIRRAFAIKTRNDFQAASLQTDPKVYTESVQLANEIAEVLRKNFVQGRRAGDGVYNIRITKDTELGSNETIKNPAPMERPSRARRREREAAQAKCGSPSSDVNTPIVQPTHLQMNFSALKRASRQREKITLNEDDLEEKFVKGGGPGGQCINKRSTNVDLLHKPTGIRVQCQETRSLQDNRRIARKLILKKLDALQNPGLSKEELRDARIRERKRRKEKKSKKKLEEKADGTAFPNI
ncbi:hypothetical protein FRB91_007768 [Serendipita sp. 411]|nr:hypothetical protein FRB91_007768 [Serendipita sp. 411]